MDFFALLLIVGALVGVSYLLPGTAQVTRSLTINAPAKAVFPYVNAMKKTESWSPWLARDPETQLTYSGPEAGVGNKMAWSSEHPQVGAGTQEIIESVENERVRTSLDFGSMGTATAYFTLETVSGGTRVTWGFTSDLGLNPMARWMGLPPFNLPTVPRVWGFWHNQRGLFGWREGLL